MKRFLKLIALLAVVVLMAGACGDDKDEGAGDGGGCDGGACDAGE